MSNHWLVGCWLVGPLVRLAYRLCYAANLGWFNSQLPLQSLCLKAMPDANGDWSNGRSNQVVTQRHDMNHWQTLSMHFRPINCFPFKGASFLLFVLVSGFSKVWSLDTGQKCEMSYQIDIEDLYSLRPAPQLKLKTFESWNSCMTGVGSRTRRRPKSFMKKSGICNQLSNRYGRCLLSVNRHDTWYEILLYIIILLSGRVQHPICLILFKERKLKCGA